MVELLAKMSKVIDNLVAAKKEDAPTAQTAQTPKEPEESPFKKYLLKNMSPFQGDKESYVNWARKFFMNINASNEKVGDVLKAIEKDEDEIDDTEDGGLGGKLLYVGEGLLCQEMVTRIIRSTRYQARGRRFHDP